MVKMMKIKLNTTLLIAGYRDPLPVGAVVEAHDVAEAGQLATLGYVTEVADGTEVTHQPHTKGEVEAASVVEDGADAGKPKQKPKQKQ